jgi:hypothetical protein
MFPKTKNEISFSRAVCVGPISRSQRKKIRRLDGTAVPMRKGSLGKDIPRVGTLVGLLLASTWWAACALLEPSSSTSSSWCRLCRQQDWVPQWLGACALAPWACSWILQGHEPNSAVSSTSGSSKRVFSVDDWRAAIRCLVLGGPWKACLRLHKIGQSPIRRFLWTRQLVGILVLKTIGPRLVVVLVEPL